MLDVWTPQPSPGEQRGARTVQPSREQWAAWRRILTFESGAVKGDNRRPWAPATFLTPDTADGHLQLPRPPPRSRTAERGVSIHEVPRSETPPQVAIPDPLLRARAGHRLRGPRGRR